MVNSNGVNDETKKQPLDKASNGFTQKTVETRILDSELRDKIAYSEERESADLGGFKGFYSANKYYVWAILIGSAIIGMLGYLAFRTPAPVAPKEANILINVEVPEVVASGSETVYKVTLKNNDTQKLVNLELELAYGDGISFVSSSPEPENLSGTLFKVPDLISGQNAVVFIKSKVIGNVNDEKTLNLKLHYTYSNFSSEFTKSQVSMVRLVASDVLIELQGPSNTNNAQLVIYNVKYTNNSKSDIKNARVKMTYPEGFKFSNSNPVPDLGNDTWSIGTLAQAGEGAIQIQGTFDAGVNTGESKTAVAEFLILGEDGKFFTQNSSSFTTGISSLPLLVSQTHEGSNGIVKPGDNLNFTIRYQNNGSTVATGVNIVLNLDTKVLDLASIRAQGGQINNNTIVWNASSIPQLENLAPNESGQLSFSVSVNNPATKDSTKNLSIISSIKIKSNEYDTFFPGGPLTLKVSSPTSITKLLSFVSGDLPPKSGGSTIYKVKLSLVNSSNDFSNGILTAFIPLGPGGLVEGSYNTAEAKNAQYDPSTGKLTWNFGSLAAYTGKFTQVKFLEFQVRLNPSSSQIGQSPSLVKTINFTAKDLFTGQEVSASTDEIRTSDVSGTGGYGNGTVVQ